jgi:hypothetical protein
MPRLLPLLRKIGAIFLFTLLSVSFLNSTSVFAQNLDQMVIEGTVSDANNQRLGNVRIFARNISTTHERQVVSNREGRFRFTALQPGEYDMRAELSGFRTMRIIISGIAGSSLRCDFRLEVGNISEQMTVEATTASSLIDTTRTVIGGTLDKREIDELPNDSRNLLDLVRLFAGTSESAFETSSLAEGDTKDRFRNSPEEAGIFALNGGLPFSNNVTIEGFDNNDDRGARERFVPTTDAVEELQVISNQFSAEYGRASGGRVNLRLRGGSNKFRGRGFYYFRDESLNANSVTRNSDPTRGFRLPYQQQNPGVSFGGPVKRDRIFFFSSYEYDYIYDRADIAALVPLESNAAFPLPQPNGASLGSTGTDRNGQPVSVNGGKAVALYDAQVTTPRIAHTWQTRTDFNLSNRHNLFGMFSLARNRDERSFPGGRRTLDTLRQTGRNSQAFSVADTFVLSERLTNDARFQFSQLSPADAPLNDQPVVIIEIDDPRDVAGNPNANPLTRTGTLTAGSSNISGTDRRENRWQFQETMAYSRSHLTFRAGLDTQMIRSRFVDLDDVTGTFRFASPAAFLNGTPSRYVHRFNTASELRNTYTGLFTQSDWRMRQNLTLALGFRWDNETILNDRNNFSPRISIAWDPLKSGKTVVRAGYGIFYNRALLRTLDDFILTSNTLVVDTNNPGATTLLSALRFPQTLQVSDPRVAQFGVREAGFTRKVSDTLRIPESYQTSFGLERELSKGFKVEANYIFSRGLHLWRESNANVPRLPAGFGSFTEYLTSQAFPNAIDPKTNARPITSTGNADLVRFDLSTTSSANSTEGSKRLVTFGLNNPSVSNATSGLRAAQAVLRTLRPDPTLTQVERLESRGNSIYHGLNLELQRRFSSRGFLRAAYTFSKLIDDGVVNTSSPLIAGDFRRERALSLLDARHRLAFSGAWQMPEILGRASLAGTLTMNSGRPFSLGISGNDRNLDDVSNDRPNFSGNLQSIRWRRSGESLDVALFNAFSLPTIGSSGNLGRNAGRGPRQWALSLRLSRKFEFRERLHFTPQFEVFNPSNSTVWSFGAEFVDFSPASGGNFLTPVRTGKPRTMRIGVRFDF